MYVCMVCMERCGLCVCLVVVNVRKVGFRKAGEVLGWKFRWDWGTG
jgi:hypothetical protein